MNVSPILNTTNTQNREVFSRTNNSINIQQSFTGSQDNSLPTGIPKNYFNNLSFRGQNNLASEVIEIIEKDPEILDKIASKKHNKQVNFSGNNTEREIKAAKVEKALKDPETLITVLEDKEVAEAFGNLAVKNNGLSEDLKKLQKTLPLWGGKTKEEKSEIIINRYSLAGAGLSLLPGFDLIALGITNSVMGKKLANLYNVPYNGHNNISKFSHTACALTLGLSAAIEPIHVIPGIGMVVNIGWSFILGKGYGHVMTSLFDSIDKGKLKVEDIDLKKESIKKMMDKGMKEAPLYEKTMKTINGLTHKHNIAIDLDNVDLHDKNLKSNEKNSNYTTTIFGIRKYDKT
jgi:hypothetical protein